MKIEIKDMMFILLFTLSIFALGLTIGNLKLIKYSNYITTEAFFDYDTFTSISCKSNSMGLTMNCNDKVFLNNLSINDPILIGNIYIYEKNKSNIIHRAIGCVTKNCSKVIFKGDNNVLADKIVNRSNIKYKVLAVQYK